MQDIYLYEDCDVLKNLLDIREKNLLDEAEADYVTYRLKEIAIKPLYGAYDYAHLLQMHHYIFQDIFEWAGQQRKLNIYKEEPVLGGLSVVYSDVLDIRKDAEYALREMRDKHWNNMNVHEAAVQFSDEIGLNPNRELFERNAQYVRTALVAYNAVFDDMGDISKPEYLIKIVEDALTSSRSE